MHHRRATIPCLLGLALLLGGCGGCQEESPPTGEAAKQEQGSKPAQGSEPGQAPEVGTTPTEKSAELPTARELPTIAGAQKAPEAAREEEAAEEEEGPADAAPPRAPARGGETYDDDEYDYEEADCIIIADVDEDFGEPPLLVQFEADYECYEDTSVSILWDFGDGNTSIEANPRHTYLREGEYVAKVTLTTPDGKKTMDELDISVERYEQFE